MVAQEIALRSPARLLSLTLEATSCDFAVARQPGVAKLFAERLRVAEERGMAAVAELPGPPLLRYQTRERAEEERARLARMSVDGFAGAWQALCLWQGSESRAHAIRTPTLVIHGEHDTALIPGSRRLARTIPGAVLEVVAEAGHSPQFERPELFNAALRRHLERHTVQRISSLCP
jgi:pimeloyl-ACP methyl ester carboxylesterase